MAPSLDYAGFPHIFGRVLEHCDLPTQYTLRRLSSSTRTDVDRHHCRYIALSTLYRDLSLYSFCHASSYSSIKYSPFINECNRKSWTQEYAASPPHPFELAIANTSFLNLIDTCYETLCISSGDASSTSEAQGESVLPDAEPLGPLPLLRKLRYTSCLALTHEVDASKQLQHSIKLPPVRELEIGVLNTDDSPCNCNPDHKVVHSARKLRILGSLIHNAGHCAFAVNAFTSTVEELVLVAESVLCVDGYLSAIMDRDRNPDLKLTVSPIRTDRNPSKDWNGCQRRWTQQLGIPVTVQWVDNM